MYTGFAYNYDKLTDDIDYNKWSDYAEKIFKKHLSSPKLILDLGCGTGSFCIEMSKKGYEMIGVDLSCDMLSCAGAKALENNVEILFLNQDMSDFELYGTVDAVFCLLDTVNYITEHTRLEKMFKLVNNYLNPSGLFIFDINTIHKFKNVLDGNIFYSVDEDITFIWENSFNEKTQICRFDLTFFEKLPDGFYKRYEEVHYEKAYGLEIILKLLNRSGFKIEGVYDNLSFELPGGGSERVFFVCRKI